ncbi:cytochrome c oxidase subunit NDUFA4 [Brachionus plicatilis]|uniref:Cytochrome c oxidase subunit NDUFA4 n=1 Tax=Brachionus plicatilis TaxID=10195 RepID=A0A3M7RKH1_BRAPC|nr:cytochrome c oxidase subunit NDUFA4 [Brachionus plicatilis]
MQLGKLFQVTVGKQIKKNYALLPIVMCSAFGIGLSSFAIIRTLMKSPDVSINRRSNPRPYEKYMNEDGVPIQYKYFSTLDYAKLPRSERPKINE